MKKNLILRLLLVSACCLPASAQVRFENDIFRVELARDSMPFNNPLDISPGTSFTFLRRSATTFAVSKGPLDYDGDVGTSFHEFRASADPDWHFKPYELKFDFPLFDRTVRQIYISAFRGIYLAPPRAPQGNWFQYGLLDIYASGTGVIAPLLHARGGLIAYPQVFLKEGPGVATFTFRNGPFTVGKYDLQVVLKSDGTIIFSYKTLDKVDWGVVAVTSGSEAWRNNRTVLASSSDPAGDVSPDVPPEFRDAVDILSYELSRISDSDVIEARIHLKQSPSTAGTHDLLYQAMIGDSISNQYTIMSQASFVGGVEILDANGLINRDAYSTRRDSEGIVLTSLQRPAGTGQIDKSSAVASFNGVQADFVPPVSTRLDPGRVGLMTDLSALTTTPTEVSMPIIEAFTRPRFDPRSVYALLGAAYAFGEREVDQIAIYPTFGTEDGLSVAGYSTVCCAALEGVSPYQTPQTQFSPALVFLNQPLESPNDSLDGAMYLLSHELGHRWLDYTLVMEDGDATNVLNPDYAHAGAYVHNPAAFRVESAFETSVMGGGFFQDVGGGTFKTPNFRAAGYSWWELYLMGLASPSEVPHWFYVSDARPDLSTGRTPGINQTYSGVRKNVGLDQLIAAMGPRIPSFEESQRTFRTLFVAVEQTDSPATAQELAAVALYASEFKKRFAAMTGNRGRIATGLPESPTAGFTMTNTGLSANFTDTSQGDPAYWTWSFGDGEASTLPNPTHVYKTAGTYTVSMTVRNSRGTSAKTAPIVVSDQKKRRAVKR